MPTKARPQQNAHDAKNRIEDGYPEGLDRFLHGVEVANIGRAFDGCLLRGKGDTRCHHYPEHEDDSGEGERSFAISGNRSADLSADCGGNKAEYKADGDP